MPDCSTTLQPLATSQDAPGLSLPNVNYTNQDYGSMKNRLVSLIEQRFPDDLTDMVEGNLFFVYLELMAYLFDTQSFKIDQLASELFIDTVGETANAFRHARLVGFQPTPPVAARAMFSATLNQVLATDLVIAAGTPVPVSGGTEPLTYELYLADPDNQPVYDQDIVIPAGSLSTTAVVGLEGETVTAPFTGTDQPNQTLALTDGPVLYDSVRVDVNGVRWTQVDAFTDSQPRSEYRVEFDSDYTAYVVFGNGRAGMVPTVGMQIEVTYRKGGGVRGNVIGGAVVAQRNYAVPGFNYAVPVTFVNYTRGEYGYDGDGVEDIRRKLPAWVKTQDRAVTGEDYQTLADQFVSPYSGQVGKSVAALRAYGCAANVVDVYVLARAGAGGLEPASPELKALLQAHLDDRKMVTHHVCVRDGGVVSVDVGVAVAVNKVYRKFKEEIARRVRNRVDEFFLLSRWDYGQPLRELDLIKAVADIQEAAAIDITLTTVDPDNSGAVVVTRFDEIIRPDNIDITITLE